MSEIFNSKVVAVADSIRADMNTIIDTVNAIRQHYSSFKATALTIKRADVRAIATKYGYDLTEWLGNDEPVPVVLE